MDTNTIITTQHNTRQLHKVCSLKFPRNAPSGYNDRDIPRYTSLRDLKDSNDKSYIERSGSSEISIKNRLVKHAASAYLQSSAILICIERRRQSCFASFRERMSRNKEALCLCWRAYFRDPIMACLHPILRFFSIVAC